MTAAHPTLPIPSLVRVTNLENGRTIVARLNDRGPFVDDRIIDLSRAAGEALDMQAKGTARVRVQYVGAAPAESNSTPAQRVEVQPVSLSPVRPAPAFQVVAEPLPDLVPAPVIAPGDDEVAYSKPAEDISSRPARSPTSEMPTQRWRS